MSFFRRQRPSWPLWWHGCGWFRGIGHTLSMGLCLRRFSIGGYQKQLIAISYLQLDSLVKSIISFSPSLKEPHGNRNRSKPGQLALKKRITSLSILLAVLVIASLSIPSGVLLVYTSSSAFSDEFVYEGVLGCVDDASPSDDPAVCNSFMSRDHSLENRCAEFHHFLALVSSMRRPCLFLSPLRC